MPCKTITWLKASAATASAAGLVLLGGCQSSADHEDREKARTATHGEQAIAILETRQDADSLAAMQFLQLCSQYRSEQAVQEAQLLAAGKDPNPPAQ